MINYILKQILVMQKVYFEHFFFYLALLRNQFHIFIQYQNVQQMVQKSFLEHLFILRSQMRILMYSDDSIHFDWYYYLKIFDSFNMGSRKLAEEIIEQIKKREKIQETSIQKLCELAKEILKTQPNTVRVRSPVTICGDIHGQLDDLLELFKIGGYPPYANYIFLGDYVDRGRDSIETFLMLLALKVRYRNRITLLRGNHESRLITQVYGFYDECIRKYGSLNVWRSFTEVFDYLTITAVVDDKIFCVHGGLSPNIKEINDLEKIDRFREVPQEGTMCDLLWSDPQMIEGWSVSARGAGYLFGRDTVEQFCHNNGFNLVARAHQLAMEGYKYMFNEKLVTVWSAPNYTYRCGNLASIMELDQNLQKYFKIFEAAPTEGKASDGKSVPLYFL